jgi:acylphosphatase
MTDTRDDGNETVHAHLLIGGEVQAVGYRKATQERAEELGVAGWVQNLTDGRVEAAFEGPEDDVEALVEWCRDGPSRARVESVDVEYDEIEGFDEFEIRR